MSEQNNDLMIMVAEVSTKLQILLDKQEDLANNISAIKNAVYEPDDGLYARLKELERRILDLESWKNISNKIIWLMIVTILGLTIKTIWAEIFI